MVEHGPAAGRMSHVVMRFFPMLLLGVIFLVIGLAPNGPHIGIIRLGNLFALLGVVLIIGATLGILFTKCPTCYAASTRSICRNEPDVRRDPDTGDLYRDLLADDRAPE
jgi:hypothetical protein